MVSNRIKAARQQKGLTVRQVSQRLVGHMSASRVNRLENGKAVASANDLDLLSRALGVPTAFFSRPPLDIGPVAFRKRADLGAKQIAQIKAITQDYMERREAVVHLLGLNAARIPTYPHKVTTVEQAEAAADWLREQWQLGNNPIHSIVDELETRDLPVIKFNVDERFGGLSSLPGAEVNFIVFNGNHSIDRQRFTLLHELGHHILAIREDNKQTEKLVNRFAGALAVPRSTLIARLGEHRHDLHPTELLSLKEDFGLSIAALLYRAKDCGIITSYTFTQGMKTLNRLKWRKVEPQVFKGRERPSRLRELVGRALSEKLIDQEKANELFGQPFVSSGLLPPSPEAMRRAEEVWRRTERTMALEDQAVTYDEAERRRHIKDLARTIQARMNETVPDLAH